MVAAKFLDDEGLKDTTADYYSWIFCSVGISCVKVPGSSGGSSMGVVNNENRDSCHVECQWSMDLNQRFFSQQSGSMALPQTLEAEQKQNSNCKNLQMGLMPGNRRSPKRTLPWTV